MRLKIAAFVLLANMPMLIAVNAPSTEEGTMEEQFDSLAAEHAWMHRSQRSWQEPARVLTARFGSDLLPLLERRGGVLSAMTLAQLAEDEERASALLKARVVQERSLPGLVAITYLPGDHAREIIHEIAPEFLSRRWVVQQHVLDRPGEARSMAHLLEAIGDRRTVELVRQWSEDDRVEAGAWRLLRHAAERIETRLAMPEPQQCARASEELIFWQTLHDFRQFRSIESGYWRQALWLRQDGLELSAEYLIEWLDREPDMDDLRTNPRLLAIALVGVQQNKEATPSLRRLAKEHSLVGRMAEDVLRELETLEWE